MEGDHLIRASGKFIVLEKLVSELVLKQKEKVLFFSGFTVMLDLCEELLGMISDHGVKFKFVRLDGGTARANRSLAIRLFNTKPGLLSFPPFSTPPILSGLTVGRVSSDAHIDASGWTWPEPCFGIQSGDA